MAKKNEKTFPLTTDNTRINDAFFYFEASLSTSAKDFRGSYDTVKLLLHLCVGKCLDLFLLLTAPRPALMFLLPL